MKAPKVWQLRVTLDTPSGRIVRPLALTDASRINATARARQLAPLPGQTVVGVEVVR